MPVSPARAAAFQILMRADHDQSYASELLHSDRNAQLSAADHGLATELVMGVLRWRSVLDQRLAAVSLSPLPRMDFEVRTALRLGVYQLQFLSRVPAHAAIFESVEIVKAARKRSAASFVNAVLRKISATHHLPDIATEIQNAAAPKSLAATSAHPDWLVERWTDRYTLATARRICLHNQTIPPTAVHVQDDLSAEELTKAGVLFSPGLLLSDARRVLSGDLSKTNAYREGRASIQDEASQLVALLLGRGQKILDCCAAPGSKTSLLARENPRAQVIATELHPHRARLLRERTRSNLHVLAADARQLPFLPGFDRILADVPCSGTGTLARNPEIKWRLTPDDLLDLQTRQIAILKSTLPLLAPGGRLLYSTCSLEREENEDVVTAGLTDAPGFNLVDCRQELAQLQRSRELVWKDIDSLLSGPYLRTIPGLHPCDGFFAAIIQRSPSQRF